MSAGINIPLCPATAEGKAKVKKTGMFLSEYSGSSPNGHSCKRTALLTTAFTKPCFSQLPYKLCIWTIPWVVGPSYGHLFRVPRVSAHESLHCSSIRQSRKAMDFHPDEGGLDSNASSLFRNVSRCSWWRYFGVIFLTCVASSDLPPQPMTHQISLRNNRSYLWTEG